MLVDGQGANAWTDGFAAAAYAGRNRAPIVLANSASGTLPESTLNFLKAGPSAKLLVGWTVTTAEVNAAAEAMGKEAALTRIFQVRMTGKNVVRTGSDATTPIWGDGAEDGSGLLTMTVDDEAGAVDFTFETAMDERYDKNALVLRRGGVDARGPVVFAMGEPDEDGKLSGRVVAEDFDDPAFTVAELIATPAAFYAELTPRDDDEAIRGQLPSGGEAHLPGEPTFIAIESKEGDDWVKVRFAAPVFTTATGAFGEAGGWSADDFTASVNNGVTTNVEAVRDLSANAADAVDFFYLDLAAVPTAGTVSIGLKASGAAKLLNNLGEHPNSGTHTQMTPLDTVKPEFAAIEAIGSSSSVTLLFSEAVHTTATNVTTSGANRHITVTSMAAGFSRTHDGAEPLNLAKAARTDRISLALAGDPIPAGAEVRVTINAAGAALIKDAKGNAMAGETTRSAATRGGGSLADVTATDLLINGAALQAQTVAFAVNDELPGDKQIKFDLPTGTGTPTYSAVEPGLSGWPAGTEVSRAGTTITFTLPSSGSVRDGQRLAVTLYEVASGTTSAQKIRITRTDTGAAADARFENRSGAQVTASSIVAGPPIAHSITITLRGAAVTANTVVDIDLSEFTAAGAVYGGTPSVSSATVAYVGNPKRAAQLSGMTGSTWTVTLPVTAPAGIWLPGLGLKASRSEPGVITADDRSRTTASPISVGPLSGWGSSATQQFAFRTVSPMSTSETFSFQFTRAPIMASPNNLAISYPATGSVTSANTAGNVTAARNTTTNVYTITYTPTATVPAGSLVVFSFSGVNTWDTDATSVPLSAAKRSNTNLHAASGTLPSFSVTGAPSAVLLVADFEDAPGGTDSNMFGDEPGDRIAFEFHVTGTGDPADNSTLTLRATANGVGTNHTVKCGSPSATSTDIVTCRRDPQDPKKIIVAVTKPLGTPIKVLPATPPPPAATVFDINGTAGWPGPSKAAANLIAVT